MLIAAPKRQDMDALVIGDEAAQVKTLTDILEEQALTAIGVSTAADTLSCVDRHRFGALVVDLKLPNSDGHGLLDDFASKMEDTPFIIHTGFASRESGKSAVIPHVFTYIEKSPDSANLLVSIHDAIRQRAELVANWQAEREEKRFRAVLETRPDATIVINWERAIAFVNDRTEELFGYRREELDGRLIDIIFP